MGSGDANGSGAPVGGLTGSSDTLGSDDATACADPMGSSDGLRDTLGSGGCIWLRTRGGGSKMAQHLGRGHL